MGGVVVGVRLPSEMAARLRGIAKSRGRPVSDIVRELLEAPSVEAPFVVPCVGVGCGRTIALTRAQVEDQLRRRAPMLHAGCAPRHHAPRHQAAAGARRPLSRVGGIGASRDGSGPWEI